MPDFLLATDQPTKLASTVIRLQATAIITPSHSVSTSEVVGQLSLSIQVPSVGFTLTPNPRMRKSGDELRARVSPSVKRASM